MNPGHWLAILFFCVGPLALLSLGFWAGTRYSRYGWTGIFARRTKELDHGPSILPIDH